MYPPNAKLTRVADATVEPLTVAQAKRYLRFDDDDQDGTEDGDIADYITAARLECEAINDRSFITTTWRLTLDYLPFAAFGGLVGPALFGFPVIHPAQDDGAIILPMPPLIAVTSLTYTDQAGAVRSIDCAPSANQVIVSPGTPGRIAPAFGTFFPFSRPTIAAVEITYTAGYGPTAASVPRTVALAMRLLVSHYYEHRSSNAEVPDAIRNLLNATRWGGYA